MNKIPLYCETKNFKIRLTFCGCCGFWKTSSVVSWGWVCSWSCVWCFCLTLAYVPRWCHIYNSTWNFHRWIIVNFWKLIHTSRGVEMFSWRYVENFENMAIARIEGQPFDFRTRILFKSWWSWWWFGFCLHLIRLIGFSAESSGAQKNSALQDERRGVESKVGSIHFSQLIWSQGIFVKL